MAKLNRLYQELSLFEGLEAPLTRAAAHYLTSVMRLRPGDSFLVFNGKEGEWLATLSKVYKKEAYFILKHLTRVQPVPSPGNCQLIFTPLKPHRLTFLIEKATETGVSALQAVLTQHTSIRHFNRIKALAQATEAAEQSERLTIPSIYEMAPLEHILATIPSSNRILVCDERRNSVSLKETLDCEGDTAISILVGPEGGFSEAEFQQMQQHPAIQFVQLGKTVLRSETAALAALALFYCR